MLHGHYSDVEAEQIDKYDSRSASMRWLISKDNGAPNFAMRVVTIEPGGIVGMHEHPNEHEIFVIRGRVRAVAVGESVDLTEGDFLLIPENAGLHSFENTGDDTLEFICCIPNPG